MIHAILTEILRKITNLTGSLNTIGKIIIIATMYFGRVSPISLAVALNLKKQNPNIIKNPVEDISVG